VLEQWVQNPYWQYFSVERDFQWKVPLEPSDFVHLGKRIGKQGVEKILQISIELHGKEAMESEVVVDMKHSAIDERNYKKRISHTQQM